MTINPRFTRGEYWLLESVARLTIPLCWLNWEHMEEALNKRGHGMTQSPLIDTLTHLFEDRLIEAHSFAHPESRSTLNEQQIKAALEERQGAGQPVTFYGLTAKGGAYWEAFAAPDWTKLIDASYVPNSENEAEFGEVLGADKALLERYIQGLRYVGVIIDPTTVVWADLHPWQATYWKQLSHGHKVIFQCQRRTEGWRWDEVPLSYYQLYENKWYSWH